MTELTGRVISNWGFIVHRNGDVEWYDADLCQACGEKMAEDDRCPGDYHYGCCEC